jgi:hypothetical protein
MRREVPVRRSAGGGAVDTCRSAAPCTQQQPSLLSSFAAALPQAARVQSPKNARRLLIESIAVD